MYIMVRDKGDNMNKIYKNLSNARGRKSAFTLAELLIVLSIIGIVAAMTLPVLVSNINDKIFKTKVKKAYFATKAACHQMLAAEDVSDLVDSNLFVLMKKDASTNDSDRINLAADARNYLASYFNINTDKSGNILISGMNRSGLTWTMEDQTKYTVKLDSTSTPTMLLVTIDANGNKKPNTAGNDQYSFALRNNCQYYYDSSNTTITGLTGASNFDTLKSNDWK